MKNKFIGLMCFYGLAHACLDINAFNGSDYRYIAVNSHTAVGTDQSSSMSDRFYKYFNKQGLYKSGLYMTHSMQYVGFGGFLLTGISFIPGGHIALSTLAVPYVIGLTGFIGFYIICMIEIKRNKARSHGWIAK